MLTEQQLNALAQQGAMDTEFPDDEGGSIVFQERTLLPQAPTPEQQAEREAAYAARIRGGYYIPGAGAFDGHEGPLASVDFIKEVSERPFHIGDGEPAAMLACTNCGGTSFEVGIGGYMLAVRCLGCHRESCAYSG